MCCGRRSEKILLRKRFLLRAKGEIRIEQGRGASVHKVLWWGDLCILGMEDPEHMAGSQRRCRRWFPVRLGCLQWEIIQGFTPEKNVIRLIVWKIAWLLCGEWTRMLGAGVVVRKEGYWLGSYK